MALTDVAIRALKQGDKPVRAFDEKGLYLEVAPSGGKWWRFKYRFMGKEKRISFGVYPEVGLKDARDRRDEARKLLANGTDPGEQRKAEKEATAQKALHSFEGVAREWFEGFRRTVKPSHAEKIIRRLEADVFPRIGGRPIADITAQELLGAMKLIEGRGALETAHRALQNCGKVFRYAVAHGLKDRDPSGDLRGALPPVKGRNFAAITDPEGVGKLLRSFDQFKGSYTVQAALRLAPLVFVRPGELRQAKWAEINFEKAEWRYHIEKTDSPHLVPLSTQALAVLQGIHEITKESMYVFEGRTKNHPISENTVNAALRKLGYDTQKDMTGHGFRAMARTILHEELEIDPAVIEHQLGHQVPDALGTAYNRTKFIKQRRAMMQRWADYLDELYIKAGRDK